MRCCFCPFLDRCEDPARYGGGCDCDGANDFGVDPIDYGDNKDAGEGEESLALMECLEHVED